MKTKLIKVEIPREQLKEYKDYVGHLFQNENGVYNICYTEEDIYKSNKWFNNLPIKVAVIDTEEYDNNIDCKVGDLIFPQCNNPELNHNVFRVDKILKDDLVEIESREGEKITSTKYILLSPKFIRWNNKSDNIEIVNSQSL